DYVLLGYVVQRFRRDMHQMKAGYSRQSALTALALAALILSGACSGGKRDFADLLSAARQDIGAGEYRAALQTLESALKQQPSDREALFFSGVCYQELNIPDTASSFYRKALRLHGSDLETARRLTDVAAQNQDWSVALEGLREMVKAGEKYETLMPRFYEIYMSGGYYAGASATLDSMIKLNPEDSRLYLRSADTKGLLGEFDRAEMILQEALRRFGPNMETYSNMGVLYTRQQKYDKAEMFFRKALELNDRNDGAWLNLANCLSVSSDPQKRREAIAAYRRVSSKIYDQLRLDTLVARLEYELGN
ncbi:MAG TPA: tetratricopeptide repeat protein, partial [candidate division Zixibacteria bacterium]|nr:tetratricopeptide repeat protein [candidate division Zixibacteria bacterium]